MGIDAQGPLPEERLALIGLRDLDEEERLLLKKSKIACYTMQDVDRHGMAKVMEMALERVDPKKSRNLHLSFDVDGCDPSVAPGTGTCARGGISYRETHYICERLAETGRLTSMDLVEINPLLDTEEAEADTSSNSSSSPMAGGVVRRPSKQVQASMPSERMHGDDPKISHESLTVRLGVGLVASALGRNIL